jgi:hypothetical protein
MAIITKTINIIPDRSLMPKIGQTGYSISQAISELIDNSIDARFDNKKLNIDIIIDRHNNIVFLADDGSGMNEEDAANSMKLAYSEKKGKLGEFGLGLKTACMSLGKRFIVTTSQSQSTYEYSIVFDEEKWLENGDWSKHEMVINNNFDIDKSGTKIQIEKLKFKIYPNLPGNIRKELSMRFAPFIENGEVDIKVNSKWCIPEPLDLKTDYCPPDGKEKIDLILESGNRIWGWRGLLKKGSEKGEYGFRVFRRGRLIEQFAKLGFNAHPEARQITGEIHVDHIPVTHNKREFIEESPLYKELVDENGKFWNYMRDIVREAKSSVRKTQIDQGIIDKMEIQKENIMKAIKTIPQLKEYAFPNIYEKTKGSKEHNEGLSNLEIEKRNAQEVVTITEQVENNGKHIRGVNKTHIKKTYYITVNGKKFKVGHDFVDLKNENVLRDTSIDRENGIHIFTNISFPAFSNTKDHVFYGVFNIAESIAEIMVRENKKPTDEIFKIRDLILKKSAEITRELDDLGREKDIAEKLKKEYEEKINKIKKLENKTLF